MPGRKSNISAVSNGPEEVADSTPARKEKEKDREGLSVDDLSLPKSMVARLAKGVLPANTQIHKDALLALHKSATVFVSYLASNSNENAQAAGKKTIAPHDVIAALKDAELEGFIPRLELELKKYNDVQCDKRNTYRRKVKEEKAAAATKDGEGDSTLPMDDAEAGAANGSTNGHTEDGAGDSYAEPPAKKLKRENGDGVAPEADDMDEDDEAGEEEADEPEDEPVEEDEVDDEEDDDDADQTMEDALEEQEETEERIEMQDEALDEPDSD